MSTETAQPAETEMSADLVASEQEFHGGALVAEALRRIGEADYAATLARQHSEAVAQHANSQDANKPRPPDMVTPDGEQIYGRAALLDYRTQMTTTAGLLLQAASLAAQIGPVWEERDPSMNSAWQDGFGQVYSLTPPPQAEQPVIDPYQQAAPGAATTDPYGNSGQHRG